MPKQFFYICALLLLFDSPVSGQVATVTDFSFDVLTGEFSVTGTEGEDSILITVSDDNTVEVGNVETNVGADEVNTIFVDGLGGDDNIDLSAVVAANFTSISAAAGAITIEGGAGNDTIFGSALNDTIKGEAGDDSIYGGPGDDHLLGDRPIGVQDGLVLDFQEITSRLGNMPHPDFAGQYLYNFDRTKDTEIADINNDGLPDIFDANSSVNREDFGAIFTSDAVVIRLNDGVGGFTVETIIPADQATTYDADIVDLDDDGYPDLIRTLRAGPEDDAVDKITVHFNRKGVIENGKPVWFDIDNPHYSHEPGGRPDDVAVGHLDDDDLLDFAIARRNLGGVEVYLNDGGRSFTPLDSTVLLATDEGSTHDVFLVDANRDTFLDIVAVNESGGRNSRLFLNDGNANFTRDEDQVFQSAFSGASADFNRDGFDDLIFAGSFNSTVALNNPASPGQFMPPVRLDSSQSGRFYDIEIGDIDNDGDLDAVAPQISGRARIWLNDGIGVFSLFGGADPLPGLDSGSVLSADMIDFDLDGDLDVYIAGDDSGRSRNQFFENISIQSGNDHLEGGPGHDTICGGAGDDIIFGGTKGGESIVGDVNRDGLVDDLDISPFIRLLQSGTFQFEADINGNGVVNFLDIGPFTVLLEGEVLVDGDDILKGDAGADLIFGGAGADTLFAFRPGVGDVNRDGAVDFSDIPPFIAVLMAGTYQFEADVDGNGLVNFADIPPFVDLLNGIVEPQLLRDARKDVLIPGFSTGDALIRDGS